MAEPQPLTLGTAGHIDHGKTALVHALTGTDTDRLPEERRRGISIALGYAELRLPSGRRMSVVDVPGHERFVRTMVAGASGIDLFLMAIAADDGPMPQTDEHATVLDALGVESGVVAITKSDRADPAAAVQAARARFPGVPVIPVSVRSGAGLRELSAAVDRLAARLPSRAGAPGPTRLHVDRIFSVTGAGTVATGTLWAGQLGERDRVVILPAGRPARIRSVEVHGERVTVARAGQRVAVALAGVHRHELARGDVVADPGSGLVASYRHTVRIDPQAAPQDRERLMIHHGTRETAARVTRLEGDRWEVRLRSPLIACPGDRMVLRRIAPPRTIGGAVVLGSTAAPGTGRCEPVAAERPTGNRPPPPVRTHELERTLREAELPPLGEIERRLIVYLEAHGSITLPALRDELGTSRRVALALLHHFDERRLTLRRSDDRRVRRT